MTGGLLHIPRRMISRRAFIQQAGAFASAAVLPAPFQRARRYKLGLQLFTLRSALRQDVEGTLRRIAGMGYEEVETYGFDPKGSATTGFRPRRSRSACASTT